MMPFGVLRTWLLGILGWSLLGVGIYLLYEWSDGVTPVPTLSSFPVPGDDQSLAIERTSAETTPELISDAAVAPDSEADTQGGTGYLVWGIALIALSTCGMIPVLALSIVSAGGEPRALTTVRSRLMSRPDGSTLHVEHFGPMTSPTLLFTHGWSLDRTAWYYVQKMLGDRYHLVVWDLPGLGKSKAATNRDQSLEKMASDLEAILTEETHGPVVLIGHSIGGMIQQVFCRLFPHHLENRVRGLVFVHTTYMNPVKTTSGSALLRILQKPVIEPLNHLMIWLSPLVWLSNWQSYLNGSLHLSTRQSSFAGEQSWSQVDYASRLSACAWPAVIARGNFAMMKFDERGTLPGIRVPALVVSARDDRMTPPSANETLAQLLPQARKVSLAPARHLGHWEQHAQFITELRAFVESLPPSPKDSQSPPESRRELTPGQLPPAPADAKVRN